MVDKRKVLITDTTMRDGHQSLWATRMSIKDIEPIAEEIDDIGYHALEVWGGATFDTCLRYLREDPWERLRTLKKLFKKTPLQMLVRGQNLVGYKHYSDEMVERFIHKAAVNGIDKFRVFDALNDLRNVEKAIECVKNEGKHAQGAIVFTKSPVHDIDDLVNIGIRYAEMGVNSICIKDMAGLLGPFTASELVSKIKSKVDLPVELHCHYIGGLAISTYIKGVEAGADIINTASLPLAFGASQPPVETLVKIFWNTPYDTGLDFSNIFDIATYFEERRKERGMDRGVTRIRDMQIFEHQVPGGMISNLITQLQQSKAEDKLSEVLAEIPKVREELGYPPLVTPTSQIVGAQAVINVLCEQRYQMIPREVKAYVRGEYGKPPTSIDAKLERMVLDDPNDKIEGRPADYIEGNEFEKAEAELKEIFNDSNNLEITEEDIISYALFPQSTKDVLTLKQNGELEKAQDEIYQELTSKGNE
ncbi:pyruvate carboxylase subunit B [Natranaerofaba carboxydovora]|uniref:pyruvate carboxylase subunit B n=1 Tax=Natranaerofaba carboxydovora TaxID=2742683 RepID=UPI001F12B9DC|nr:pyruvate carboxylase subunit B [Natranaerofaba carboxydovora]UMZ73574.1 2-oxoglutarate carboxylase large subunit [Natranaerofaba carboxydovora]